MFIHSIYTTGSPREARSARQGGRRCRSAGHGARGEYGGFAFGGYPGGPRGRGRKARRGDIRTAALLLVAEEPRNGYQIMQEVQERSGDVWRPSPGSVYPALQQLEDEGLIRLEEHDGRRLYALTDEGRKLVDERAKENRPAPWEQMSRDFGGEAHQIGRLMREVAGAFVQVMRTGSEGQVARARDVLVETRRSLYNILADGDEATEDGGEGSEPNA